MANATLQRQPSPHEYPLPHPRTVPFAPSPTPKLVTSPKNDRYTSPTAHMRNTRSCSYPPIPLHRRNTKSKKETSGRGGKREIPHLPPMPPSGESESPSPLPPRSCVRHVGVRDGMPQVGKAEPCKSTRGLEEEKPALPPFPARATGFSACGVSAPSWLRIPRGRRRAVEAAPIKKSTKNKQGRKRNHAGSPPAPEIRDHLSHPYTGAQPCRALLCALNLPPPGPIDPSLPSRGRSRKNATRRGKGEVRGHPHPHTRRTGQGIMFSSRAPVSGGTHEDGSAVARS